MRLTYLKKTPGTDRLILIFAGWGTDAATYRQCLREGWDLLVCHDYTTLHFPVEELEKYSTVYLYAWSLGVAAASVTLPPEKITKRYAINGTPVPVSDTYGIPEEIFRMTRENLDQRNLKKFRRRMADSAESFAALEKLLPENPDIESLKTELTSIETATCTGGGNVTSDGCHSQFIWTRVYIGDGDRIFPPSNQSRCWETCCECDEIIRLDAPHYIPLDEIMGQTIPDPELIGDSFRKALPTYDSNSSPQQHIASRLAGIIQERGKNPGGTIIEIGSGTGHLTRRYHKFLCPEKVTHVELYPISPFSLAPEEEYVTEDAERWISRVETEADYILSASTIQWFTNPDLFFRNAARILRKKEGMLICSTFGKGNLHELDRLRPAPLSYLTARDIKEMLGKYFNEVNVEEEEIILEFANVRELLKHLHDTGVKGSTRNPSSTLRKFTSIYGNDPIKLTYHPIYITASF